MTSHSSRPTLAAVAISRNEEQDMPRFLEHLLPWVNEIVIVDDGSQDRTQEIVRAAGPKVKLVEQSMGEAGFAGQRNAGIAAATADWLLHMDIDERVTPELASEILTAIANPDYNGYRYRRLNFFLNRPMKGSGLQKWNHCHLARRGRHHFKNVLHEICVVEGSPQSIGQLQSQMWHLNDASYSERLDKSRRYCQGFAERLLANGYRVRWYDPLLRPTLTLASMYLRYAAYRDGIPGLIFSLHCASSIFRSYAFAWDVQNSLPRQQLEIELARHWQARFPAELKSTAPEERHPIPTPTPSPRQPE